MDAYRVTIGSLIVLLFCGASAPALAANESFAIQVPALAATPQMNGTVDDSWAKAAQATTAFDFTYQHASTDPSTVYIAQDAAGIDVAFVATQHEPITDATETNGQGVLNDDNVTVALYPQGVNGLAYTFSANPRGARYQTSSENTAYTPQWTASARLTSGGYVVTMHIPYAIIRSGGATSWRAQFERTVVATNSTIVWEHIPGQRNAADPAYAGTLSGISDRISSASSRPKPRLQVYGLGESTTKGNGGDTTRIGADIALPVTATSSFVASFHPDYSNLEVDQQTIAPTAYQRQYNEFRPFFTQSASYFNGHFSCTNCPTTLYTPSIPAFSHGYAYEGTQGPLTFGAFDAVGTGRADSGQTLNFTVSNPNFAYSANAQRVSVDTPTVHDDVTTLSNGFINQHGHDFVYFNEGQDRGSNVTDPGFAQYFEYGGGYVTQTTTAGLTLQKIGDQFNPVDGFVAQTNIAGYLAFVNHTFEFSSKAPLHDVIWNSSYGRYNNDSGQVAQTDGSATITFDLRDLVQFMVSQNSSGVRGFDGEFLPYNSNELYLGYKVATTTPSYVSHSGGLFYHGRLNAWTYHTTQPLRRNLTLTLEADEDQYGAGLAVEPAVTQWLERASVDWQLSRDSSFDLGLRRIIGRNLPNSVQAPDLPTLDEPYGIINGSNPLDYVNAGNVTAAFHFLASRNEFYAVYGDPNSLATTPALYVKWIRYVGADKGT